MHRLAGFLCLVALPTMAGARGGPAAHTVASRCPWETESVAGVVAAFARPADAELRSTAEAALDRHHVAHGWGGWIGGRNPIPFESSPTCAAAALTALHRAARACPDPRMRFEARKVAAVLERNGRAADAAELLEAHAGHTRRLNDVDWHREQRERGDARAAARSWGWAYYHYSNDNPPTRCGNAFFGSQLHRNHRVADCLLHLERWEELRALCRSVIRDPWGGSPCFVEPLVESYHRQGLPDLVAADVEAIRGGLLPDGRRRLDAALAHWEILRLPDHLAYLRLPEILTPEHAERAAEFLERVGPNGVRYWTDQLDRRRAAWTPADLNLLTALAHTGDPGFGRALERWSQDAPLRQRKHLQRAREAWASAARGG